MNRNSDSSDVTVTSSQQRVDIDDINVYETVISKNKRKFMEKERKLSHERKPSYSSSEKSLTITSQSSHSTLPASVNPVKLRESSAIRRQRRSGLGHKDEMNSSSGNWSASSESGRTSIGSEITAQPKSSASSTSLNHSHHPGSGPPSSIISRRRFLNTSASSSVTSEGTVTPDIQIADPYDDETSSAYSCDTEGYYTSFHVDSGLKTLKEEEPVTPLHTSSALSSTNSFGSTSNKTVLSAENEYELFGKGSTSTTASSAGTVCTTLMTAGDSDRCLANGPAVPERKSSLTKLHRSNSTASNCTLERSCSSSTVGSTLERTGTIKRNGILLKKEVSSVKSTTTASRTESPDSGNNTSSSPVETNSSSSPIHGVRCNSEFEYSECSDLEGVERVERIRVKTTINSSRIPSLCVITPSNSDDDDELHAQQPRQRHASPAAAHLIETDLDKLHFNTKSQPPVNGQVQIMTINKETGYATLHTFTDELQKAPVVVPTAKAEYKKENNVQHFKKATLLPLNTMFGRLRGVLPHLKKSPPLKEAVVPDEPIYDNAGEYVTIADVKNNNQKTKNGVYYSNDTVKRNLATVLSGNLNEETEYVSLNELPSNIRCESNLLASGSTNQNAVAVTTTPSSGRDEKINSNAGKVGEYGTNDVDCAANRDDEGQLMAKKGARVTLDAHGKVVYSSDSLKRRKGAHTTFAPGPCVKDSTVTSSIISNNININNNNVKTSIATASVQPIVGGVSNRKPAIVRPVISQSLHKPIAHSNTLVSSSISDKVVLRAENQNIIPTPTTTSTQAASGISQASSSLVQQPATTMLYSGNVLPPTTLGNGNLLNQPKQGKVKLKNNAIVNHFLCTTSSSSFHLSTTSSSSDCQRIAAILDDPINERTVKRSNSYRLANSPLLLSIPLNSDKNFEHFDHKIHDELRCEQINYPESVSPQLKCAFPHLKSSPSLPAKPQHLLLNTNTKKINSSIPTSSSSFIRRKQPLPDPSGGGSNSITSVVAIVPPRNRPKHNLPIVGNNKEANSASYDEGCVEKRTTFLSHNGNSGGSCSFASHPQLPVGDDMSTCIAEDTVSIASSKGSSIAKSFEKLMDEFSLSMSLTRADESSPPGDSSYLRSQSIENVESSDEFFDSDNDLGFLKAPLNRQQRLSAVYVASPNRITRPTDGHQFRALVLSFNAAGAAASGSTDIW